MRATNREVKTLIPRSTYSGSKPLVFFLLCTLFCAQNSVAQRILTANDTSLELKAAIHQAMSGDTILIPEGEYSVNEEIIIPSGISVRGAGRGKTVLRGAGGISISGGQQRLSSQSGITISGITFDGVGELRIKNEIDFRVFNCTFKNMTNGILVGGNSRGVIDHNNFYNIRRYGVVIYGDGDASWDRPLQFGTEDAIFVEDNLFELNNWHNIASNNGSRYVFRYNTMKDKTVGAHAVDAHGFSSWPRGGRSYEIYNNTIEAEKRWAGIGIRGGDGVIFDNKLIGQFQHSIVLNNDGAGAGQGDNCNYPCKDQTRSLYIWNNSINDNPIDIDNRTPNILQQNRDYFRYAKPDYTPYIYPHPLVSGVDSPLRIVTNSLTNALNGRLYSAVLIASGGQPPYRWEIINGALPSGLALEDDTLSGTPNDQERSYAFTIQVTDSENAASSMELTLQILSSSFSSVPYFGDVGNWQPDNTSYWTVEEKDGDKRYIISTSQLTSNNNRLATYSLVKDRAYTDFQMTLKAKSPENLQDNQGADFAIVFGYQNDDNYYYMLFNSNAQWSALHIVQNGSRSQIVSSNTALINDNGYHDFEISRQGNRIMVKRDQVIVLTIEDGTLGSGNVGIGSLNDAAYFDDIDIRTSADNQSPSPPQNVKVELQGN